MIGQQNTVMRMTVRRDHLRHFFTQSVTIQCHDNPDADAIASGFALYKYFLSLGRQVQLVYAGRNQIHKSNLDAG